MARSHRFQIILVSVFLWICGVAAHGRLTVPPPRAHYLGIADYIENMPVALSSTAFVCRDEPRQTPQVTLNAGDAIPFAWSFTALHPGDCFAYLSYDGSDSIPDSQKRFFKIAQWAECKNQTDIEQNLVIPSYLPSCSNCILRFEWYALHRRPDIEYYTQCVDVTINGNANGGLPSPMVYPGNTSLPVDGTQYRDPYNPGPFWFTGPPIATYGGSSNTVAPVATTKPAAPATTKPVTVATTKPAATVAPATTKPVTVATTKPAAPATTKPVVAPATTKPVTVATTKPATVATTKPAGSKPCVFGYQRCSSSETFETCLAPGGVNTWTAEQSCAPGTTCHDTDGPFIVCDY